MDNRTFGYARVSSKEQHEDRQIEALINYGVAKTISLSINALAKIPNVRDINI